MILPLSCKISPVDVDFLGTLAIGEHWILAMLINGSVSGGNTIDPPLAAFFQICSQTSRILDDADGCTLALCLTLG